MPPQPRYRQVAKTLINEIQAGTYPVGDLMPTEMVLCEQFGASRFTVREAIKQLVELGLVNRTGRSSAIKVTWAGAKIDLPAGDAGTLRSPAIHG